MPDVALMLLAAGAATRMGQPKQLLDFAGRPLIRHCTEIALASVCRPIVVVLGANADRVRPALADLPVRVVLNERWEAGVGTSIQAGLAALAGETSSGVLLTLADLPFIPARAFNDLVECHLSRGVSLVASSYSDTLGVPALFGRALFPELLNLEASAGCKGILLRHASNLASLPCPEAAADLDTPEDYARMKPAGIPAALATPSPR